MTEIVAEMEKQFPLFWQENRLKTFKSWTFDEESPCSAKKLAEAGFYFVGSAEEPDAVQCFYCDKALDGWDKNDDPWEEHRNHAQKCQFAELRQPEEALTLSQLCNFKVQLLKKHFEKGKEEMNVKVEKDFQLRMGKLKKTLSVSK